jgi:anti-anti-sigma factor
MVVHVAGEFDVATLPVLEQALARTYQAEENVYLDLSGVTFFDAASLGAVVGAHRLLAEDGRALVIVNPTRALTRLLRIADLDTLLLPAAS